MPNKNLLNKDTTAYNYLLTLLSKKSDADSINAILDALLTDKEQLELANRLRIFAMLKQGKPQRQISETLGVGIATVSRGAKAYQTHEVSNLLPNIEDALSE